MDQVRGIVVRSTWVVVRDEVVELVSRLQRIIDLPEQEGADRILAEEAVEQLLDLLAIPDELALDRR